MKRKIGIDKTGIKEEDKEIAVDILGKLRNGERVFGNPGEGLKKTLKNIDEKIQKSKSSDPLEWTIVDKDLIKEKNLAKAGLSGEQQLAEYIEKIVKNDPELHGITFFASLSENYQDHLEESGYIPDTDFIAVYGNNIMILDAKNIRVQEDSPLYIIENKLMSLNTVLMELSPSNYFWENLFLKEGLDVKTDGCVVIISQSKALIFKNQEWYISPCKPVYIGDLRQFLLDWINKIEDNKISLRLLVFLSKMQIKKNEQKISYGRTIDRFKR